MRPDEIPQGVDLVRWDNDLCEHVRPEYVREPLCVDAICFDCLVGNNPVL